MMGNKEKNEPAGNKKPDKPPVLILLIMAVIIFGVMFAFMYFENTNPDWLRPTG